MINILWAVLLVAYANAPSRDYEVELNRDVLRVRVAKTGRVFIERNLREIATWQLEEVPADRLNPLTRRVLLQTRDGRNTIGLRLTGDDGIDQAILNRITAVVPPAPDIAPTLFGRIDRLAQRLIGWR